MVRPAALPDERELVRRATAGDQRAFEQIYRLHAAPVVGFLQRNVRSRELAEDLASETFILAFRHLAGFEWKSGGLRSWLFRIAIRQSAGHFRKRSSTESPTDTAPEVGHEHVERDAVDSSADVELVRALRSLPITQRLVLDLRYFHDLSPREVAEALGISAETERQRATRGLAALRKHLESSSKEREP